MLCYTAGGYLRILNFNAQRTTEKVFEGRVLVNHIAVTQLQTGLLDLDSLHGMQVLGYAHDITVLHCDFGSFGQYVFAIDVSDATPSSGSSTHGLHPRVRLCSRIRSNNKLFVRHTDKYLVVGSHSATGSHGHHEWLLQAFHLDTAEPVHAEPLQLQGFYGSEIGSTACFTLHQDEFYAVTNQTSLESEEVDWTSYYHVVRFRVDNPQPELVIKVFWRRQHLEGPINDAWTDLGFQIDQRTGELLLVECRKEWANGGSKSIRTYYTQSLHRVRLKDLKEGMRHPPTNDRLISTLDETSNSRYEEPGVRIDRYVHTEFPATNEETVKEYIRAKTKWNRYSFNTQCFVDLVTDEFIPEGEWRPRQRVRLRVVSRQELSPLVRDQRSLHPTALMVRPRIRDRDEMELEDSERMFSPSSVYLWPPDDAPQELYDVLCPDGRAGDVSAILGDEGIIYMAGPSREPGSPERALVFISFDPTFGFIGMRRLDGTFAMPKRERKRKTSGGPEQASRTVKDDVSLVAKEEYRHLAGSSLAERPKRLKVEGEAAVEAYNLGPSPDPSTDPAHTRFHAAPNLSTAAEDKPEPDVAVPPQGDATAQALGLDPPSSWPAFGSKTQRSDHFTGPIDSATASGDQQDEGRGKGKARARTPSPPTPAPTTSTHNCTRTRTTWRENAAYLAINQGFWLR
ncbi:F-box domain protein [Cladophialophora carrionii]|uniref:F-box domain protein n=1 Tax=Cladophialophora carrionii TaxID=86049 RepID=A0A1C1CHD7_9EURO|nr:F-box domain protein [Cladophialophora carrionii]